MERAGISNSSDLISELEWTRLAQRQCSAVQCWAQSGYQELQLFVENFKLADETQVTGQLFECSRPGVENVVCSD